MRKRSCRSSSRNARYCPSADRLHLLDDGRRGVAHQAPAARVARPTAPFAAGRQWRARCWRDWSWHATEWCAGSRAGRSGQSACDRRRVRIKRPCGVVRAERSDDDPNAPYVQVACGRRRRQRATLHSIHLPGNQAIAGFQSDWWRAPPKSTMLPQPHDPGLQVRYRSSLTMPASDPPYRAQVLAPLLRASASGRTCWLAARNGSSCHVARSAIGTERLRPLP